MNAGTRLLSSICIAFVVACGSEEPRRNTPGIPAPEHVGRMEVKPEPRVERASPDRPLRRPPTSARLETRGPQRAEADGPASAGAGVEPPETPTEERDLARELVAQLRPEACLDARRAAAQPEGRVTVHATATLLPSGRASRAQARVPGQPPEALECLVRQLEQIRLPPPIAGAPLRVSGQLDVEVDSRH